jgi:hypothetical protein
VLAQGNRQQIIKLEVATQVRGAGAGAGQWEVALVFSSAKSWENGGKS